MRVEALEPKNQLSRTRKKKKFFCSIPDLFSLAGGV